MHQGAFSAIEAWSRVQHPNIVQVREAFTTRAFNDNCLCFIHPQFYCFDVCPIDSSCGVV